LIAQRKGKRGTLLTKAKPPNLDKKTELQNHQRAAHPFDWLVGHNDV
jgi:hypothetical protein